MRGCTRLTHGQWPPHPTRCARAHAAYLSRPPTCHACSTKATIPAAVAAAPPPAPAPSVAAPAPAPAAPGGAGFDEYLDDLLGSGPAAPAGTAAGAAPSGGGPAATQASGGKQAAQAGATAGAVPSAADVEAAVAAAMQQRIAAKLKALTVVRQPWAGRSVLACASQLLLHAVSRRTSATLPCPHSKVACFKWPS